MAVPTRVRRGTSGNDYYYWDGVNPMRPLENGFGDILRDSFGIGLITLAVNDFEVMQAELEGQLQTFGFIGGNGLKENTDYLQAVADAVNSP